MKETPSGFENDKSPESRDVAIAEQANYEGNWSQLLFQRLLSPEIFEQLVNLYKEQRVFAEDLESFEVIELEDSEIRVDHEDIQRVKRQPRTDAYFRRMVEDRIKEAGRHTKISFARGYPNSSKMRINWHDPATGEVVSTKVQNMVEAHEKGHVIREFLDAFILEKFAGVFDFESFEPTQWHYDFYQRYIETERVSLAEKGIEVANEFGAEPSEENVKEAFIGPLKIGNELLERMAQLKNYFGFKGAEQFTKDHLDYAKKHYLEDVGFDNSISVMFACIKPEMEERFIILVDTLGI